MCDEESKTPTTTARTVNINSPHQSLPQSSRPIQANYTNLTAPSTAMTDADASDTAPTYEEATYRYMYTSTGTVIDIAISDWRLHLNLSSKFRFLNDVTERFSPASDTDTVSFEIGLQRDLESPEAHSPTINELTVKIHSIPSARHRISALQTLFRECAASSSLTTTTLTVRITAEPCQAGEAIFPWEFGFDFDMSTLVVARNRGTCLMFSREEPPAYMETYLGPDSPNYELMKDKRLKADGFAELFAERLLRMRYGEVEMWRCAAVGYRRER